MRPREIKSMIRELLAEADNIERQLWKVKAAIEVLTPYANAPDPNDEPAPAADVAVTPTVRP